MRLATLVLPLALLAVGCGGGDETASVVLEGDFTTTLTVEVADSEEERRRGLMGREELASDAGMIFLFDEPTSSPFVMRNTLVPLSIAFADAKGRIVTVRDMEPCRAEPCPTYSADEPYTAALEVNRGAFDRWGIGVGDRLRIEGEAG